MADDKKKSAKKTAKAGKKTTVKLVSNAKAAVKKGKKNLTTGTAVTIQVPSGGQVIKFFNLIPAMPSASAPGDWLFTEQGSTDDINTLVVGFPENPSALEREFERAILVISMQQNPQVNGTWRFALGGVATDHADEDPNNDISLEIIDNGFTMLVYVHVLENSAEQIPFGFVASFTDAATGAVSIYESQDPGIVPVRPIGP